MSSASSIPESLLQFKVYRGNFSLGATAACAMPQVLAESHQSIGHSRGQLAFLHIRYHQKNNVQVSISPCMDVNRRRTQSLLLLLYLNCKTALLSARSKGQSREPRMNARQVDAKQTIHLCLAVGIFPIAQFRGVLACAGLRIVALAVHFIQT